MTQADANAGLSLLPGVLLVRDACTVLIRYPASMDQAVFKGTRDLF